MKSPPFFVAIHFGVWLAACAAACGAGDSAAPVAPSMAEVSPGVYQIGKIRINQQEHTAAFPGRLNMAEGALEYLLVTPEGAAHESLLVTDVQPADLHFAMLLLGAKGAGISTPAPGSAPPAQINNDYLRNAPQLKGDAIYINVKWKQGGEEKMLPVEDWMVNPETRKIVSRGPWLYTGSMFIEDKFLAQVEGAFASLVTYPSALINNPRKGNDNDLIWAVNEKAVPPASTPVEIVIKLDAPAAATAQPSK